MLRNLFVFLILLTVSTATFAQEVFKVPTDRQFGRVIIGTPPGGYLGIQPKEVTKENYTSFGLSEVRGVAISKVVEKSPAANAGVRENDVIVRFNGNSVTSTRQLLRLISEVAPDHQATLTVLRNGSEQNLTVTIGKRETPYSGNVFNLENPPDFPNSPNFSRIPLPPSGALIPKLENGGGQFAYIFGSNRQIGVGVTPLTKQLGDYFGATEGKGLLINNVSENSPAAGAGLQAGDIITSVDGKEVNEIPALTRVLNEKKEGVVTITFLRNKVQQTVTVEPKKLSENNFPKSEDIQKLMREYQKVTR